MRGLATILLLCISLISFSTNDISYFRKNFIGANSETKASAYINAEIEKSDLNEKITINAYKAVVTMRMAEFVINPISKLSWFKEGKKKLGMI